MRQHAQSPSNAIMRHTPPHHQHQEQHPQHPQTRQLTQSPSNATLRVPRALSSPDHLPPLQHTPPHPQHQEQHPQRP
ncbi:hypothetical protein BDZ94DRAFT_1310835 [Collybia nuda]|uniref:Uncharacterized protein n=1 Tax=Collybia nuda TaxID=64659 RepID=A0A9P5Y0L6_9AGAR|nr:hypothetical protein BDZ94DRAFT_1310835 [Collybia nuda]